MLLHHPKETKTRTEMDQTTSPKSTIRKNIITVTYTKGLSESFKNICKKHGIQVYFRGDKTIKDLLVAPKDIPSLKRIVSYTGISVTGWNVMRSI